MNLNIDKYGGSSVVPLRCGSEIGTAFFVSKNQLLTATHLVKEQIQNEKTIEVRINHQDWIPCTVAGHLQDENTISDVTLLNLAGTRSNDAFLELIASSFHKGEDLKIIGYPWEIGNGLDYFGLDIRSIHKINPRTANTEETDGLSYDVVAVRNDLLSLYSYGGFSGSPILNEYGKVVGVATDQHYNSLSYTSIEKIAPYLRDFKVRVTEDSDIYDPTIYGNGYAHKKLEEKLRLAGTRYSRELHIKNNSFERAISSFCCLNSGKIKSDIYKSFVYLRDKLEGEAKEYIERPNTDDYRNPFFTYGANNNEIDEFMPQIIETFLDLRDKDGENRMVKNPERAKWNSLRIFMEEYLEFNDFEKGNFMAVSAFAGMGKTHSICQFVDSKRNDAQFYLFFGNEFKGDSPEKVICDQLGWSNDSFEALNSKMEDAGKYAIIVIDGINEGAGYYYWIEHLKTFLSLFERFKHIKVIITYREMNESDKLRDEFDENTLTFTLNGFENKSEAINKFFKHHNIPIDSKNVLKFSEFSSPLYLKLFCSAYKQEWAKFNISRDIVYREYLRKKNSKVCQLVDENPSNDITNRMIDYLISESVNKYLLGDVPVKNALNRANRIAPYRTWSNNLLHILLQESILKEYQPVDSDPLVGFEFDSIGDYLKMRMLTDGREYKDIKSIVNSLAGRLRQNDKKHLWPATNNVLNFIFTEHKFDSDTLDKFLEDPILKANFLKSLPELRMDETYRNTVGSILKKILADDKQLTNPLYILYNFKSFSEEIINTLHSNLASMPMVERDAQWTRQVNDLALHPYPINWILSYSKSLEDIRSLIILNGWMLTTTAVDFRAGLIKAMCNIFRCNSVKECVRFAIDSFKLVDDQYVMQGIMAAAYAALVLERDSAASKCIADHILKTFYPGKSSAPSDLIVRNWTMKIVELANILDSSYEGWKNLILMMPFESVKNPFENLSKDNYEDNYFGNSRGASMLYGSLYALDFARYVIGTNNSIYSPIFKYPSKEPLKDNNEGAVPLQSLQNAIARIIKEEYGYSDRIGKIDEEYVSRSRFRNKRERFGKKYQWLGFYKVLSYLCDNCSLTLDRWSDYQRTAEYNFPWLTGHIPHTDPTIGIDEELSVLSDELFHKIPNDEFDSADSTKWTDKEGRLPSSNFIITDKRNRSWVVLNGIDTQEKFIEGTRYVGTVWYNSVMVANKDKEEFQQWCKKDANMRQDFTTSGNYEYMWNDYPYSNAFIEKRYDSNMKEDWNCPVDVILSTETQLQEYFEGSENEYEFLGSASSPNVEMMRHLDLHNAERGVIRNSNGDIIAININPIYPRMSALVILKDALDEYLKTENMALYFFILINKQEVALKYQLLGDITLESVKEYDPDSRENIKDILPFDTYTANLEKRAAQNSTKTDLPFDDMWEEIRNNILSSYADFSKFDGIADE